MAFLLFLRLKECREFSHCGSSSYSRPRHSQFPAIFHRTPNRLPLPLGIIETKVSNLTVVCVPAQQAGPHVSSQLAVGPGGDQSRWLKPVWFYISLKIRVAGSVMLSPQPRPCVNVRATGSDLALPLPLVTVNTRDKSTSHARNSHTEVSKERRYWRKNGNEFLEILFIQYVYQIGNLMKIHYSWYGYDVL